MTGGDLAALQAELNLATLRGEHLSTDLTLRVLIAGLQAPEWTAQACDAAPQGSAWQIVTATTPEQRRQMLTQVRRPMTRGSEAPDLIEERAPLPRHIWISVVLDAHALATRARLLNQREDPTLQDWHDWGLSRPDGDVRLIKALEQGGFAPLPSRLHHEWLTAKVGGVGFSDLSPLLRRTSMRPPALKLAQLAVWNRMRSSRLSDRAFGDGDSSVWLDEHFLIGMATPGGLMPEHLAQPLDTLARDFRTWNVGQSDAPLPDPETAGQLLSRLGSLQANPAGDQGPAWHDPYRLTAKEQISEGTLSTEFSRPQIARGSRLLDISGDEAEQTRRFEAHMRVICSFAGLRLPPRPWPPHMRRVLELWALERALKASPEAMITLRPWERLIRTPDHARPSPAMRWNQPPRAREPLPGWAPVLFPLLSAYHVQDRRSAEHAEDQQPAAREFSVS